MHIKLSNTLQLMWDTFSKWGNEHVDCFVIVNYRSTCNYFLCSSEVCALKEFNVSLGFQMFRGCDLFADFGKISRFVWCQQHSIVNQHLMTYNTFVLLFSFCHLVMNILGVTVCEMSVQMDVQYNKEVSWNVLCKQVKTFNKLVVKSFINYYIWLVCSFENTVQVKKTNSIFSFPWTKWNNLKNKIISTSRVQARNLPWLLNPAV